MIRRRIGLAAIFAVMVCLMFCACGTDSSAETAQFDPAKAEDSPEWVGKLAQAKDADQLFVVAAIGKTTAYVSMHQKDDQGAWKQVMTTPGYIGKNGMNKEKEGDYKTPTGTYHFNYAFGINKDPGCKAFKYQQVTDDDYWSGDQRKDHSYNKMVSIKDIIALNPLSIDQSFRFRTVWSIYFYFHLKCFCNGDFVFFHKEKPPDFMVLFAPFGRVTVKAHI